MEKDLSTLKPEAAADHDAITPTTRSSLSDPAELDKTTLVGRFNRSISYSKARGDGRIELKDTDCYEITGYSYPTWKKWWILSVVFAVQVSMNLNASLYANAVSGMEERFSISNAAARVGQMIFLVAYAFGCELWAPWSEEYGRWPIMQLSLLFVNIWAIPCGVAQNYGTVIVARFFGGICSAGGGVTLGVVADLFEPENQQWAVAFVVLSSVGGSAVGPIMGGFIEHNLNWRWNFWVMLIIGAVVQFAHFFTPETRSSVLVTREAKRRRKAGEPNLYSSKELEGSVLSIRFILQTWARPFIMFATEPIVLCLSLLSGFSDALIFIFLEGFGPVFKQWGFNEVTTGLAFIPIMVGYFLAYFMFLVVIWRDMKVKRAHPEKFTPESRLWFLLFTAPLEPIGLFGFAWTSMGPPQSHWIAPMLFSSLIGIANYAIYMATIDYMVAAYGPYASSATGGNGFARDFLAGIAAMYATPMYTNIPGRPLEYASTILACIGVLVCIPVYVFYYNGQYFRDRSKFAQTLAAERAEHKHIVEEVNRKATRGEVEQIEDVKEKA